MSDSDISTNGRDDRGRFVPGNRFSRGNPHHRRIARLRTVLLKATTPERMQKVAETLLGLAESGDVQAARLLLSYTVGPPPQQLDVTADVRTAAVAQVKIFELPAKGSIPSGPGGPAPRIA